MKSQLLCGNTLDVLTGLDADIVDVGITSPPYNKQEKQKGWLVKNVVYDTFRDVVPEQEYQDHQVDVLNEVYRVTKPGGAFFYNHKVRWHRGRMYHPMDWLRKTRWTIRQEIIWDRMIAANIRGWRYWQVEERIYWLQKSIDGNLIGEELRSQEAKLTSVWRAVPENKNPHPAPFPLWLPARVILSILKDRSNGVVLDPYMGSGTTAVAAKLLGHKYIGIDISENYLEYAKQRIEKSDEEKHLIKKELALHNVGMTFERRKELGKTTAPLF